MFTLNFQKTIDIDYQGVNISEFSYSNTENLSEDNLIDFFIHSKSFTEESRREIIKNDKENRPFLRQAFEIDFLKLDDFKQTDKKGVIKFLNDYTEEDDWKSDKDDFIKIKDKFIESLKFVESDNFYLISKEWFDEKDQILREPESWIYAYYFLIIWLNTANGKLTVSEWTYD